jgi:hypothetical protein
LRKTFSRPVKSGWKPDPSSSNAAVRPYVSTVPTVGLRVPAMSCSRVDLAAVVADDAD